MSKAELRKFLALRSPQQLAEEILILYERLPSVREYFEGRLLTARGAEEALNKSEFRDAVENVVLVDTASTLNGGDESGETADLRELGVAEQREKDAA